MSQPFYRKIEELKDIFSKFSSKREIYQKILNFGEKLPPISTELSKDENKVIGCQSNVYIIASFIEGTVHFTACSDALISAGLAYILTYVYTGSEAKTILLQPPSFLEDLQIPHALSMSRSNGLYQMYKHLQKITLVEAQKILK